MREVFAQLVGKPAQVYTPSHDVAIADMLLETYHAWCSTVGGQQPVKDIQNVAQEGYLSAQFYVKESLRDVPLDGLVLQFFTMMLSENFPQPHHLSGLFLNALIQQAGKGAYSLPGLDAFNLVGFGLDGVMIESNAFGSYAGAFLPYAEFRTTVPRKIPRHGAVFVAKKFGHNAGAYSKRVHIVDGTFDVCAASTAGNVTIDYGLFDDDAAQMAEYVRIRNGRFGHGTAHDAQRVIIDDGTFGDLTGASTRKVTIYGGQFGDHVASYAKVFECFGGDFGMSRSSESSPDPDNTVVHVPRAQVILLNGNVLHYEKDGSMRWKIGH